MTDSEREPNRKLRRARGEMSQAQLAEKVNAALLRSTGRPGAVTSKSVSDWERGWYSWPIVSVRAALREVLGVAGDAELGFENRRARAVDERDATRRSIALAELAGHDAPDVSFVDVPGGRFFQGAELAAVTAPSVLVDGGLVLERSSELLASLARPHRRTLLVTHTVAEDGPVVHVADGREFAAGAVRRSVSHRVPNAYRLDDMTIGVVWAVSNTDSAILADDSRLDSYQQLLAHYEERSASSATLSEVPKLNDVSSKWLGSDFCARHIIRHLPRLTTDPFFWSREQRGEEAAAWLLWTHKLTYLRHTAARYANMRRGFCIPEHEVRASPRYERVLALLAVALMEAHGVEVQISSEPELGEIEGFVVADDLIVANWLRGTGLWYVDTDAPSSRWSAYREIAGHAATKSIIAHPSPAGRLQAMATYLEVPWTWFAARCRELASAGVDGLAHPRSRLVSTDGLMAALRYVANVNQPQNP
ncbi:helix-turn-helix transcriptional regulator [Kribbella sp. NPDC050459]|uniref:helix-turn-helix transcriptional regulator n=1 Tax=Kribbella sp. NPDC050459 TaxID=3155785 RepID=UPI0033EBE913